MMKYHHCFVMIISCLGPISGVNVQYFYNDVISSLHAASNHHILSTLKNYHLVVPYHLEDTGKQRWRGVRTELQQESGLHIKDAHFSFDLEGQNYILDLSINQQLLPHSFTVSSYSHEGKLQMHIPTVKERNHCYYQGSVRNIEESQVIMSTCNGLRGYIILSNEIMIIQPLTDDDEKLNNSRHVVYRMEDMKKDAKAHYFTCGNTESKETLETYLPFLLHLPKPPNTSHFPHKRNIGTEKKFVELLVVADKLTATIFSNRVTIEAHIKELVNIVDGFYQKLKIRIVLSHIEIWSDSDKFFISTDPVKALDGLVSYRKSRMASETSSSPWVYADNVQLLFGGDFDGTTVGIAPVKSMCGDSSVGVNQDKGRNEVLSTASTVAHEMGHNFGMQHDTNTCDCPIRAECIMADTAGHNTLEENAKLGTQTCLVNVPDPSRIFGGPQCGNEIVESGEECDCGPAGICQSHCCNASSCLLFPGKNCDSGLCCNDCQFAKPGTVCRALNGNTCELPELCTGISANCPSNTYVEDGTLCLNGSAFCYKGICLTHDLQCETIWGKGSLSAVDDCYRVTNREGNDNGNCGKNDQGYIKCSPSNSKCGKLHCQGGTKEPPNTYYTNTLQPGQITCRTLASRDAGGATDPGLVSDGTICDNGKVCMDNNCTKPLLLNCSSQCNGRGVCNQFRHCHCDYGWSPPNCVAEGYGGSVDSGHKSITNKINILMILMIIGFSALLLGLTLVLIWYRNRR